MIFQMYYKTSFWKIGPCIFKPMLLFKIKYELEGLGGLKYAIGLDVLLREDFYTRLKSVLYEDETVGRKTGHYVMGFLVDPHLSEASSFQMFFIPMLHSSEASWFRRFVNPKIKWGSLIRRFVNPKIKWGSLIQNKNGGH